MITSHAIEMATFDDVVIHSEKAMKATWEPIKGTLAHENNRSNIRFFQ